MPNWCTNNVTITGDKEKIKEVVKGMDFNKIMPMPKELNIIEGSVTNDAEKFVSNPTPVEIDENGKFMGYHVGHITASTPYGKPSSDISYLYKGKEPVRFADFVELGKIAISNKEKYGARSWYEWRCINWGTKWNACDVYIDELENGFSYSFETAWGIPVGILDKFTLLLPDCHIEWRADIEMDDSFIITAYQGDTHCERIEVNYDMEPEDPSILEGE